MSISDVRNRIGAARIKLERARADRDALEERIRESLDALHELLECEPGDAKQAIKDLRDRIASEEREISELLDEVEGGDADGDA